MSRSLSLPQDVEDKLTQYRKSRKSETGKMIFRETAIVELLRKSLDGFEPPRPLESRLDEIERRLLALELRGQQHE